MGFEEKIKNFESLSMMGTSMTALSPHSVHVQNKIKITY